MYIYIYHQVKAAKAKSPRQLHNPHWLTNRSLLHQIILWEIWTCSTHLDEDFEPSFAKFGL